MQKISNHFEIFLTIEKDKRHLLTIFYSALFLKGLS